MSDELKEVKDIETEIQNEEAQFITETGRSKYEDSARIQGWVPKEEWKGDPDDWRPAKEFVERGELLGSISSVRHENKELKKAIGALLEHHNKVKETEFSRALDYLKNQKKAALESGDADQLLKVEEAIDVVKEEQKQHVSTTNKPTNKQLSPEFVSWANQNPWYIENVEMRSFADDVGVGFFNRNPSASEQEVYAYVAKRVAQAFPDKFKKGGVKVEQVEGGSGSGRPVKTDSFKLSEEEAQVMRTFVRQGVMTEAQYKEELKRVKGLA